jgi:uncharacterized protein with von Willebrand factor type A (vWA) domain
VAASAGPKNVILVLDFSGSMAQNGRIDIAKAAAKAVLDTLTFADFVSVVSVRKFHPIVLSSDIHDSLTMTYWCSSPVSLASLATSLRHW